MMDLPLFPLNRVLFPAIPLNLHIFEERYKLMMNERIDKREPFGVVLISNDEADISPNVKPYSVGCTAYIKQLEPLSEGRMNLTVVGRERFKIHELHYDKPYLSAKVELFPLEVERSEQLLYTNSLLRNQISRYMTILKRTENHHLQPSKLPLSPILVAHLAADVLQLPPKDKQPFLEIAKLDDLIAQLLKTYRYEIVLSETLMNPPDEDLNFRNIFSLN
jgi:Lon protease-like protein